jgi:1,4-dihydroxy-2-naphthoate polyprenyltransferase
MRPARRPCPVLVGARAPRRRTCYARRLVSAISTWVQAARPLAQANIAIPVVLGATLAAAASGAFDWVLLVLALGIGVLAQLFIVFANDVADEAGDRGNRLYNFASGGSRVLAQSKLERTTLGRAALVMALLLFLACAGIALLFGRPLLLAFWAVTVGLTWAYSFAPFRLSYRGGGEAAQGLGVGVVLPLMGWYLQVGNLHGVPWAALVPAFVLGVASNITTALPDAPADAEVEKRTWPVRQGPPRARKHSLQLIAIGTLLTPLVLPGLSHAGLAATQVLPALALLLNLRGLRGAEAENRSACRRFVVLNALAIQLTMLGWIAALILEPSVLSATP